MRTALIFLGIIAVLAIVGLVLLGLAQPTSRENQSQYESQPSNQQSTSPKGEPNNKQNQTNAWTKIKNSIEQNDKVVVALSTAVIAAFTAALVLATVLLFFSSEKVADASKKSAEVAQESLVKIQRAFLSVNQMRYLSHIDSEGKVWWSFHIDWQNSGGTAALKAKFFTTRYLESVDLPTDFKFPLPVERPEIFVAPRGNIGTGNIGIDAADLIAVREKKKFLYFWGRVDYRDIFDSTPDHVTKFLIQVLDFRGDVTKVWDQQTNIVEIITINPNRHNCADESCPPEY
jgi:flagellar basal body-associated protein FliL